MPNPDRELIEALTRLIAFLDQSVDATYTETTVIEVKKILKQEISRIEMTNTFDRKAISLLIAPTGAIQEIAIDNGWSDSYFELSSIIDRYTED